MRAIQAEPNSKRSDVRSEDSLRSSSILGGQVSKVRARRASRTPSRFDLRGNRGRGGERNPRTPFEKEVLRIHEPMPSHDMAPRVQRKYQDEIRRTPNRAGKLFSQLPKAN